jgi:hypothetical protein
MHALPRVTPLQYEEVDGASADYKDLLKVPIIFEGRRTYDPEIMISQARARGSNMKLMIKSEMREFMWRW